MAKHCHVHFFFAFATMYDCPLYQLNIKNAFLHGDLIEEVYMEQPSDFITQGEIVYRLKKTLYELKQSPRAWFGKFSEAVLSFGMTRYRVDHSVFDFHLAHGSVWLLVYVDYISITDNDNFSTRTLTPNICSCWSIFRSRDSKVQGGTMYFLKEVHTWSSIWDEPFRSQTSLLSYGCE